MSIQGDSIKAGPSYVLAHPGQTINSNLTNSLGYASCMSWDPKEASLGHQT